MNIKLTGYLPDKELNVLAALLFEHGITEEVRGFFTNTEFITDKDISDNVAQLIASTFAPTSARVLEQRAEAQRQELFAEYDKMAQMYQRLVRLGVDGAEAKLAKWDAYAEALRAVNDMENWFLNPQWPVKPEV